ncbi:Transthyretin-like family protein [Acanthocheilonema viteae]
MCCTFTSGDRHVITGELNCGVAPLPEAVIKLKNGKEIGNLHLVSKTTTDDRGKFVIVGNIAGQWNSIPNLEIIHTCDNHVDDYGRPVEQRHRSVSFMVPPRFAAKSKKDVKIFDIGRLNMQTNFKCKPIDQ